MTSDGVFLDGRNRIQVGCALELDPVIEKIDPLDPAAYIISENIIRRHLSAGQRATIAEKIANMSHGTNRFTKVESTEVPSMTKEEAAKQLGTTPKASDAMLILPTGDKAMLRCRRNSPSLCT